MRCCDKIENIKFCHSTARRDKIEESSRMARRDNIEAFSIMARQAKYPPLSGG